MKEDIDHIIEEALKAEPSFKLNSDFRNRTFKAIRKLESRAQRRLFVLIAFGSLLMVLVGVSTVAYFLPGLLDFSAISSSTQGIDSLVPIAILIGILLVVIQFLDKKLIKDRYLSH